MSRLPIAGVGLLTLLLASCSLQREQLSPRLETIEIQPRWSQAASDSAANWYAPLNNAELAAALAAVLANNPQLTGAQYALDAAVHEARASGADAWPQLSANLSSGRSLSNSLYSNSFQADLSLNWDLDIWDSLGNSARIAIINADNARASLLAAQQNLVYALLSDWLQMLSLQTRIDLLQERIANYQEQLDIIDTRIAQGLASIADLHSIRATIANSEDALYDAQYRLAATQRSIRFSARATELELSTPALPPIPELGNDLLQQDIRASRTDLVQAQNALAAQDLRLANAINARLPSLSLSTSLGRSASTTDDLLLSDANFANIVFNLGAPIFDYDKRRALAEQARALAYQNFHNYQDLLSQAIHESEELLQQDANLERRKAARQRALRNWLALGDILEEQYLLGLQDYQSLLDNEQRIFDSELSALDLQHESWLNRLNLAQALGTLPLELSDDN